MTTANDIYTLSSLNAKSIVVSGDIHGEFNQLVHKLCVQYAMRDTLLDEIWSKVRKHFPPPCRVLYSPHSARLDI